MTWLNAYSTDTVFHVNRGCVTPNVLEKLSKVKLEQVQGFSALR